MNYNQSTIGDMFSSKMSFRILVYQRAYAWETDNWKMFLSDILERICFVKLVIIGFGNGYRTI